MPFPLGAIPVVGGLLGGLMQGQQNKRAWERESQYGREMQDRAYRQNLELMKYQNMYNSPVEQMARYKAAGLNPNLIYGQGNSGNMSSAPQMQAPSTPRYQTVDIAGGVQSTIGNILQTRAQNQQIELMKSQEALNRQKAGESQQKIELMQTQQQVLEANPMLNSSYVKAFVGNMESIATLKKQEADYYTKPGSQTVGDTSYGAQLMQQKLMYLTEKYGLLKEDAKIKAEIFNSKQMQNDLLEIQRDFMKSGNISEGQILTFLKMLILRLM